MVDSSKSSYLNVSLRTDLDGLDWSVDKLKTWKPQNFTSLLNNPQTQYSFYEDMKNKIYSGLYDTATADFHDISKDFEKFSDIGSPTSGSSGISFKTLINDNYDDYINRIKNEFSEYMSNHIDRNKKMKLIIEGGCDILYQSSGKIHKIIPKDFITEENFKIPREVLEMNRNEIEWYCRDSIEKCGEIELEIERVLLHSRKIYNYINENVQPLYEDLSFSINKIEEIKKAKVSLKRNFLLNSGKNIINGIKKKNLTQLNELLNNVNALKEILELLKVLSKDQSKYQITRDLIDKGKQVLDKINSRERPKILKFYEDEFKKICNKSIEKVTIELANLIEENLVSLIKINREADLKCIVKETDITVEFNFDFQNNNILNDYINIFNQINFIDTFKESSNKKLKEILSIIFKYDVNFYSKLRNILTTKVFDFVLKVKDYLTKLVYSNNIQRRESFDNSERLKIASLNETDKQDIIYLILSIRSMRSVTSRLEQLSSFILTTLKEFYNMQNTKAEEDKTKDLTIKKYKEELNEIKQIIEIETGKIIESIFSKFLKTAMKPNYIDLFINHFSILKEIANKNYPESNSLVELFNKFGNEYILLFMSSKMNKLKESIECEDWTAVNYIPIGHQKMVDFILKFKYTNYRMEILETRKFLDSFAIQTEENLNEEDRSCLKIEKENHEPANFKLVLSSLDLIKVFFDFLKLGSFLDERFVPAINSSISDYTKSFVKYVKEYILDGEAFKRGIIKRLSQAEVSIANSNLLIIRSLLLALIKNNEAEFEKVFDENLMNADKIRQTCRYNMSDMLNSSIKESLESLSKIDFTNYPVFPDEDKRPISDWVKKYHKFNPAYLSMINTFEEIDISNTMREILKLFFDKLEGVIKEINEKSKLVDQARQKQFKRDMTAIKKNLKTFKLVGDLIETYQEKVDLITKIVLPKVAKKKKEEK